jgi:hypothetical protein
MQNNDKTIYCQGRISWVLLLFALHPLPSIVNGMNVPKNFSGVMVMIAVST